MVRLFWITACSHVAREQLSVGPECPITLIHANEPSLVQDRPTSGLICDSDDEIFSNTSLCHVYRSCLVIYSDAVRVRFVARLTGTAKSGAVLRGPATEPVTTYRVVVEGKIGRVEKEN